MFSRYRAKVTRCVHQWTGEEVKLTATESLLIVQIGRIFEKMYKGMKNFVCLIVTFL
jgi:hypothetical protein